MRTVNKGARDLVVIGLGAIANALAENATGFGVPPEYAPVVAATALALYRLVRDRLQGQPA